MKTSVLCAILAPATVAYAQWWDGAPDCAKDCFSSHWSSASNWPAPTSYCSATQAASVHSCIASACSATPTVVTSYSSLSSSLCANWASCSSAGSTGVYTITAPAFTGTWRPGRYGPNGGRWGDDDDDDNNNDDDDFWSRDRDHDDNHDDDHDDNHGDNHDDDHDWDDRFDDDDDDDDHTWSGGVYTVTGCEWSGNPWAGGPGGWGAGGAREGSPWGPWGKGWTWRTETETVTRVATVTGKSGSKVLTTSVGLATVALAVNGDVTSTSLVNGANGGRAVETGRNASGGGGGGDDDDGGVQQGAAVGGRTQVESGVMVMGALLAGVVVVAGLL